MTLNNQETQIIVIWRQFAIKNPVSSGFNQCLPTAIVLRLLPNNVFAPLSAWAALRKLTRRGAYLNNVNMGLKSNFCFLHMV